MPFVPDDEVAPPQTGGGGFVPDNPPMPPKMGPGAPPPTYWQRFKQAAMPEAPSEAVLNMASAFPATAAGGYMGLAQALGGGGKEGSGADVSQAVQSALTFQPRKPMGQAISTVAGVPGELLGRAGEWAGSGTANVTGSPALGAGANAALQVAPMLIPGGLRRAGTAIKERQAGLAAERMFSDTEPAPKAVGPDPAAIERARESGLRLTPSEGGGGFITRNLETFSGEPALAKSVARANEPIVEKMISKDIPGTLGEITPDSLARARQMANQGYEAARNSGNMIADSILQNSLERSVAEFQARANAFPKNPELRAQAEAAKRVVEGIGDSPVMSADATVSLINSLRKQARAAYAGGSDLDKQLAPVRRDTADALEAQIERHLKQTKQSPEIISNFQAARTVLAKAHEAERASASGTINPQYYGRKYQNRGGGLTGEAQKVGQAAVEFPRSMANPRNVGNPTGPTATDVVMSAAANSLMPGKGSLGLDLLSLGGRPAIRALLASRLGQSMIGQPVVSPALTYGTLPAVAQESAEEAAKR